MKVLEFYESDIGFCRMYYKDQSGNTYVMQECGYGGVLKFELLGADCLGGEPDERKSFNNLKFEAVPEINEWHKDFNTFLTENGIMGQVL